MLCLIIISLLYTRWDRLWEDHPDPSVSVWSWHRAAGHRRHHSAPPSCCNLTGWKGGRGEEDPTWQAGINYTQIFFIALYRPHSSSLARNTSYTTCGHSSFKLKFMCMFLCSGWLHSAFWRCHLLWDKAEVYDGWHALARGDRRPLTAALHCGGAGWSSWAHSAHWCTVRCS